MAFSSKAVFTPSPTPFSQKRTSGIIKPNHLELASSVASQNGRTTQDLTWASSSLEHFKYATEHPNITSDDFHIWHQHHVEVFKHVLDKRRSSKDTFEGLAMIDAIQRLGIDYYFQDEIHSILERDFRHIASISPGDDDDLHETALRFRLLRQEGYHVTAENFNDKDGKLKRKLVGDIDGLMSVYEASHLSLPGEDILDIAGEYSEGLLRSWLKDPGSPQARLVRNTLRHPHHKSLARFGARNFFMDLNETNNRWLNLLQELARYDFKMVQSQHQQEIFQISEWWKEIGLSKDLTFARDQPLKWYTWSMASLADPSFSQQRIDLTKPISFIYIIDDIFDVYGTLEELTLFTEVVNRWDIAASEQLPDYMKICFNALNKITDEISYNVYKECGWNPVESLRKTWARLCTAFLVEARWFASKQLPSSEEYLKNGIVSSGVHVFLVHLFFLLGQGITKETVELIDNNPGIISSAAKILRLWDDLGSAEDEEQDGNDGSFVECYMKEHSGTSMEDARRHAMHMISEAWKHLNQECLSPNPFSATFTKASLNIARLVPLMYNYDGDHRLPSLEEHMKSLLHDRLPM